jgi:hypothetical protein
MIDLQNQGSFLFYNGPDGAINAHVVLGNETVWLTQKGMSQVFEVEVPNISKHLENIYSEEELQREATVSKMEIVQTEAGREVKRLVNFYNLDAIIAVGYRVSSYKATQFRIWANKILKEYLIKGFVLDDERLKQGNRIFNKDYFKDLLERIREIRASERMFYEKITDLYALSVDYNKNDPETHKFFAKVQNKLEFAIVGNTSAEIIKSRADAKLPYMGLKTWKNSGREGKVQKSDVTVAKNYLNEAEIRKLNTLVNMYLDYAELQVERNRLMQMSDWAKRLDAFLEFNEYEVLDNAGKVSKNTADDYAENEYIKFRVIQDRDYKSDFDKTVSQIRQTNTLPTETEISAAKESESDFDSKLKVLLNTPPPPKKPTNPY